MIIYHAYHKNKPSFYIGKTEKCLEHRRKQHENESRYNRGGSIFHKALRKYGIDAFDWGILENCTTSTELNAAEIRWINLVKSCGHRLYNISPGGTGGDMGGSKYWAKHGLRKEMKEKISLSLKDYFSLNDHPMKGVKGTSSPSYGRRHTEEAKNKVRLSKIGKPRDEETKQKLRKANLGKKLSDEAKLKISARTRGASNPSAKKIICVTTNEIFDYATLASVKYYTDLSSIIKCCKGKMKTANGRVYKYFS